MFLAGDLTNLVRSRRQDTLFLALFPAIPPLEGTKFRKVVRRRPIPKRVSYLFHCSPPRQRLVDNLSFPELDPGANSALPPPASLQSLPLFWDTLEPGLFTSSTWAVAPPSLGAGRGRLSILPAGPARVGEGGRKWADTVNCSPGFLPSLLCKGFTLCLPPVLSHHIPPGGVAESQTHLVPEVRM